MPANTIDLIPGGGPNQPGGLAQITNCGFNSTSTTGSAIQPAYSFSDDSLGFYQSASSTVALSYGTLTVPANFALTSSGSLIMNAARFISMRTVGAISAAGLLADEVVFGIVLASGASLAIKSGGTIWVFNSASSQTG